MITFYRLKDPYGCFSNFSRHEVDLLSAGGRFPTSEHAYQAMKFHPHRPDLVDLIRQASTPRIAADAGRNLSYPLRADWESPVKPLLKGLMCPDGDFDDQVPRPSPAEPLFTRMKDYIMYEVVLAKFEQNADIKEILLSTGTEGIVEDSNNDAYWGWGATRSGENKLGRVLMAVRQVLRETLND